MKNEFRLKKAYGSNKFSLADLPRNISGITISRIRIGADMGCAHCFPHGYETINSRWDKVQRSWKSHRATQWKPKK